MEAGISINAFVKKVLDEAVQQPLQAPEPAMLMEPDSPGYGIKGNIGFSVPSKDVDFAKELAKHLGWKEV